MRKSKTIALTVCSSIFALSVSALIGINATSFFASAEEGSTWKMANGASIRVEDPAGIRFTATVSESQYTDNLTDIEGEREVTFGMVIMPYEYVATYGQIEETTLFGADGERKYYWNAEDQADGLTKILHYEVDDLKTVKNGQYYFNCSMTNINPANYGREFYARAYYSVYDVATEKTEYHFTDLNDNANVRSVSYVAQAALEDNADKTSETYGDYNEYVGTFSKYGCVVGQTLVAATGKTDASESRIACTHYLSIEEIKSVSVNENYCITWIAYDADKNYIGNGNKGEGKWLNAGETFTPKTIFNITDDKDYSKAVYFRFAIKKAADGKMTVDDVENLGLTIVCEETLRTATSLDETMFLGTSADWTLEKDDDGNITSATSNGSGQEIKYFAQTGIAYTVEATIDLENNLTPNETDDGPWTDAGFVIQGANGAKYAFMTFLKNDDITYEMWLVNLNDWNDVEWLNKCNITNDGVLTMKLVNDGTQVKLYCNDEEKITLTAEGYPNIIGQENAVGLITVDDSATFSNISVTFEAQRKVAGTVSVSDDLGVVYDLDKTVVYAETETGKTITLTGKVNADGEFSASVPADTVKLTFSCEGLLLESSEIALGTGAIDGISVEFDKLAPQATTVVNGVTLTGKAVGSNTDYSAWTIGENSVTSGTASREVQFFAQTADKYIVETTVSGLETTWHQAGIVFSMADGYYYAFTAMPYNATQVSPMFIQFNSTTWEPAWWNGENDKYAVPVADSYKLSIVNDGAYMWFYLNDTLVKYIQNDENITLTNKTISVDFIGKEHAIGLVSIDPSQKTFSDFSLNLKNFSLNFVVKALSSSEGKLVEDTSANTKDRFISNTEYLTIDQVESISFNSIGDTPYKLQWFAYTANGDFKGSSEYIENGSFNPSEIWKTYSDAVYFRVRLRRSDSTTISLTEKSIQAANVVVTPKSGTYTYIGQPISIETTFGDATKGTSFTNTLTYKQVGGFTNNTYYYQDGATYGDYIFVYNSGTNLCEVYDKTYTFVSSFGLVNNDDTPVPHSNSVCFGTQKYDDGDEFPLLYANVYNASNGAKPGVCNVYRIVKTVGGETTTFTSTLVQIIKIGFTGDTALWTTGIRPYGNFVVDTDNNKLYCYVMVDETNVTRFFEFDLPTFTAPAESETLIVEVVELAADKITAQFETPYFGYMQGVCYHDGKLYTLEGSPDRNFENILRVIDLSSQKEVSRINLTDIGITDEPETIYVDNGTLYIATVFGAVYELAFY